MYTTIGEKIAVLRKEAGFTQAQLAERINLSRPALVKIENSQRSISLEEGDAISKALGLSLDSLLVVENNDVPEKSFAMAFKMRGMNEENLKEIAKFELLFDVLITQEKIYKGE